MKVVMTQAINSAGIAVFKDAGAEVYIANDSNMHNYLDQVRDADVIVIRIATLDRVVIENAPKLKVIGRPGVGVDCIDVATATERGIPVVVTPRANSHAVAEHTIGMMFAIAKNFVENDVETKNGNYTQVRALGKIFDLEAKKVAVIGMGAIGSEVTRLCNALGMKVMGYDPYLTKEKIESLGAEYVANFEDVLPIADILTVHVPLVEETKNLITKKHLASMKKTAIVINNARGGIVNEQDLADALNEGLIAGAGVDVFTVEPPTAEFPLFKAKNILVTPHTAAQTRETSAKVGRMCAQGCLEVLAGKKCSHVCNPKVYEHDLWKGK